MKMIPGSSTARGTFPPPGTAGEILSIPEFMDAQGRVDSENDLKLFAGHGT